MADSKIREKILKDAKSDAEKIIQEAKNKTEEILSQSTRRVKEIEKETENLSKDAKQREMERRLSEARMQSRKVILQEKRKIIDSVFDEAKKRLLSLNKDKYINFLSLMIREETKGENFSFVLAEKDVNRFGETFFKELLKKLNLKETEAKFEKGNFDGGCIIKKEKYEFNATVDTILGRIKERLESELQKTLFA